LFGIDLPFGIDRKYGMNQRIQELALQAGAYVNSVYTPPVRSKTPGKIWEDGHINWHTQFNQKFAELLVAECASIVEDAVTHREPASTYVDKIKKHFGVEQ